MVYLVLRRVIWWLITRQELAVLRFGKWAAMSIVVFSNVKVFYYGSRKWTPSTNGSRKCQMVFYFRKKRLWNAY